MGWNSWNQVHCEVSSLLVKGAIDQIKNLQLDKVGYNYVIIDDCWQAAQRDSNGHIMADPVKFPNGIKEVADYAHS